MFERFTDEARHAVVHAQERARHLRSREITSAHVLLGIVDADGVGARALRDAGVERARLEDLAATTAADGLDAEALRAIGIDLDAVSARADAVFGDGALERAAPGGRRRRSPGHLPFTREAKKSLELALREALALRHKHIDSGHLLLGLLRADDAGAAILERAGADPDALRTATVHAIGNAA